MLNSRSQAGCRINEIIPIYVHGQGVACGGDFCLYGV